jgi:hypothetical protein
MWLRPGPRPPWSTTSSSHSLAGALIDEIGDQGGNDIILLLGLPCPDACYHRGGARPSHDRRGIACPSALAGVTSGLERCRTVGSLRFGNDGTIDRRFRRRGGLGHDGLPRRSWLRRLQRGDAR